MERMKLPRVRVKVPDDFAKVLKGLEGAKGTLVWASRLKSGEYLCAVHLDDRHPIYGIFVDVVIVNPIERRFDFIGELIDGFTVEDVGRMAKIIGGDKNTFLSDYGPLPKWIVGKRINERITEGA